MQDTKIESSSDSQQLEAPVREARPKSSFDDAEYQRWSEKLRNRSRSNKK